jgi:hypothetical protein
MDNQQNLQKQYVETFSTKEKRGYEIAKSLLGMSFDLEKSIGYQEWKKKQNEGNSK